MTTFACFVIAMAGFSLLTLIAGLAVMFCAEASRRTKNEMESYDNFKTR